MRKSTFRVSLQHIHPHPPDFKRGEMESPQVVEVIDQTYQKNVHWRSNIFKIPSGKQGKAFVKEMAHLFTCYAEGSSMGRIALKMAMIFPALVLQKPS